MRSATKGARWRDLAHALLAVGLAGIAWWQSELGVRELRQQLEHLRTSITEVKEQVDAVRSEGQAAAKSTRKLENTARVLLKDQQRRQGGDSWPWR